MQYFNTCKKIVYLKNGIDETEYSKNTFEKKEKLELYVKLISEGCKQSTALQAIGISKATYYRWKNCYKKDGLRGLENKTCVPHNIRQSKLSQKEERQILYLRRKYPLFGKYKIVVLLKRLFNTYMSASSVGRVLKRLLLRKVIQSVQFYFGRTRIKRKRIFNRHAQRWHYGMKSEYPGHMVQVDHMTISMGAGYSIKQFTAICPFTRLSVEQAYNRATSKTAKEFLNYMCNELPFKIDSIQVDGGSEFMADFEDACRNSNIQLYVLPPRSPKFNGNVERCNSTSKYECYALYDGELNLYSIRKHLKRFMHHYNTFRPHQALQYQTPWQYYKSLGA